MALACLGSVCVCLGRSYIVFVYSFSFSFGMWEEGREKLKQLGKVGES